MVYMLEVVFRSCVFCQWVLWFECMGVSSCKVCCQRFCIKRFLQVLIFFFFFFFFFLVLQFVSEGFFRFWVFVRVLDVRRVLQVHCFGVSEVSRFKCQRISSGLVLKFEVWVSNDFKAYLTKAYVKKSIKGCQRLRCLFLQVQSLFIRRGKTIFVASVSVSEDCSSV